MILKAEDHPPMNSVSEYVNYARECENLARLAQTTEDRERLLELARAWMSLATGEDEMREPDAQTRE